MITGTILANAGTPLMWATGLHLLFGNLLIGIGEGVLLWLIFRVRILRAIGWMVLANYFSAWSAYLILKSLLPMLNSDITIYTVQKAIWIAYGVAYLYTLFAEWPFIYHLFYQKAKKVRISILATVIIQTISYAALAYWYKGASYDGLFQNAEIVRSLDFINNKKAMVYFIGQDKNIYQVGIDGLHTEKIYEPAKKRELMKLYLKNGDLCVSLLKDIYVEREDVSYTVKKDILNSRQMETISLYEQESFRFWQLAHHIPI